MSKLRSLTRLFALAASFLALRTGVAHAQAAPKKEMGSLISINPLGLPFQYVSAESESRLTKMVTLGSSLSWLSVDDGTYFSLEAKLRIYPNEEAPKGFSIGVGAGATHLNINNFDGDHSVTRPAVSALADYNWLLGKSKRFLVGAGVGAKRIFIGDVDCGALRCAYPTGRFQVGVLF